MTNRGFKCDRCNKPCSIGQLWGITLFPNTLAAKDFDICLKCKNDFMKFMEKKLKEYDIQSTLTYT